MPAGLGVSARWLDCGLGPRAHVATYLKLRGHLRDQSVAHTAQVGVQIIHGTSPASHATNSTSKRQAMSLFTPITNASVNHKC